MKRSYTITICPVLVAPSLCWRWTVEATITEEDGNDHEEIASGLDSDVCRAGAAATLAAGRAEEALRDGEDVR